MASFSMSSSKLKWIERRSGVWEVICSNPVGDSGFSLSHAPDMLIISFSQRGFMLRENDWSLPKYFPSKAKWILRRYYFCLAQAIKNSSGQMRQLYAHDANESIRRLVEDGMSPAFTNTRTARGFSIVYHVFSWKQYILCSALRHKSYLTLP